MLIGQTIFVTDDEDQAYYSPWMPFPADNAIFTYERVYSTLSAGETVTVQHKRHEDAGADGATVATLSTQLGSTDFFQGENTDPIKDLIRYKVQFPGSSEGELLHIRFTAPTPFSTARV